MNKEELIKKIKALAEAGKGGEKENAQVMLKKLMKKYKIKEADIETETIKEFKIKLPKIYKAMALASQVIYSIVGKQDKYGKGLYKRKSSWLIKCTNAEFLEFEAKYKFYCYHYKKEMNRFYEAFIQANRIFPPKGMENDRDDDFELTEEDYKMLAMAANLENHQYRLQIAGGEE